MKADSALMQNELRQNLATFDGPTGPNNVARIFLYFACLAGTIPNRIETKIIMKFMITWQFHQGKLHEGYSQFFKMTPEQDAADRGSRIKQIGRWHDLARGRGVVICESDSAEAVANWALNWNGLLDADVVPVLDDNETRALGKSREKSS